MRPMNSFDWRLHASIVFKVLTNLEYLRERGVLFELRGSTIKVVRGGGIGTCPTEINDFDDALAVLHWHGCATTQHFDAIILLKGASYYKLLNRGQKLLNVLSKEAQAQ